jgi:hypothetical protein
MVLITFLIWSISPWTSTVSATPETFIPKSSGENFLPHVTAGLASEDFVKKVKTEPFAAFTFLELLSPLVCR